MVKIITYKNKYGFPQTMTLEVYDEDEVFIFCKRPEDGEKKRIEKADIVEIKELKIK